MCKLRIPRAFLVYQAGIANVFAVECHNLKGYGRDARRLWQGDFRSAEMFARGLGAAGTIVQSAACNQAGDIIGACWTDDLKSQPFADAMRSVKCNTAC